MTTSLLRRTALLGSLLLAAAAAPLAAQNVSRAGEREFRWSGGIGRGDLVRVSNISGDVRITGADAEQVHVVATLRRGSSDTEARVEVKEHDGGITICALHGPESRCDARGAHQEGRGRRWNDDQGYYDIEVRVPRTVRVAAGSVSGDVHVTGTTSELRASSVSGDIRLDRVRAIRELAATTVSGDVNARLDAVTAGTELRFRSVSGDVSVSMPRTTGFDLALSTVSGDLESEFALEMRGRFNRRRIQARINDGGSDLNVSTVSGDVRLAQNGGASQ